MNNDSSSVNLGLRFSSTVAGNVTAVRFYKGRRNTGTHVGALWTSTGGQLASATFANETKSGWQQANFTQPVAISANTTYVVSYLAPRGRYADDQYYNWSSLPTSPLKVVGTAPGVYAYGLATAFPNASSNGSNYWVDLVFEPDTAPPPPPPPPPTYTISGTVSGTYAAIIQLSGTMAASSGTSTTGAYSFAGLVNGAYSVTPSLSGYSFNPSSASLSINGADMTGVNFSATAIPPPPPPPQHSVDLSWTASTTSTVVGYHVFRGTTSGGPYTLLTSTAVAGTAYTDSSVTAGATYYYVATAVDSSNAESGYSNESAAVIPTP